MRTLPWKSATHRVRRTRRRAAGRADFDARVPAAGRLAALLPRDHPLRMILVRGDLPRAGRGGRLFLYQAFAVVYGPSQAIWLAVHRRITPARWHRMYGVQKARRVNQAISPGTQVHWPVTSSGIRGRVGLLRLLRRRTSPRPARSLRDAGAALVLAPSRYGRGRETWWAPIYTARPCATVQVVDRRPTSTAGAAGPHARRGRVIAPDGRTVASARPATRDLVSARLLVADLASTRTMPPRPPRRRLWSAVPSPRHTPSPRRSEASLMSSRSSHRARGAGAPHHRIIPLAERPTGNRVTRVHESGSGSNIMAADVRHRRARAERCSAQASGGALVAIILGTAVGALFNGAALGPGTTNGWACPR